MNPVLLASASALAEATPEKAAISAPTTSTSGSTFSLPQAGLNAVAERLIGAKINQQQASLPEHQRDDADPAGHAGIAGDVTGATGTAVNACGGAEAA